MKREKLGIYHLIFGDLQTTFLRRKPRGLFLEQRRPQTKIVGSGEQRVA